MKNRKGVTLISLIITVIVLIILATVAVYSGTDIIESSKLTTFTAEMKRMQTEVNSIYDKYKMNQKIEVDGKAYEGAEILNIEEKSVTNEITSKKDQIFRELSYDSKAGIKEEDKNNYKYWSKDLLKKLGIEGTEGSYFVNLGKRSIISYEGLKYENEMYYTLNQLPDNLYNVEYGGAYRTYGYVEKDLILHYDAIHNTRNGHNSKAEIWEDLSGNGKDGELKNFDIKSAWTEKNLIFDGIDDGVYLGDKVSGLLKGNNTIEIVIKFAEDNARDIIIGNYNNNNSTNYEKNSSGKFRIYYNKGAYEGTYNENILESGENQLLSYVTQKANGTITLYKNASGAYNCSAGNTISTYNFDWKGVWIGRDNRPNENEKVPLKGSICSVRVYGRALTEKELKQNYEIDKKRFDLQ